MMATLQIRLQGPVIMHRHDEAPLFLLVQRMIIGKTIETPAAGSAIRGGTGSQKNLMGDSLGGGIKTRKIRSPAIGPADFRR
jgi:hypothetical protein